MYKRQKLTPQELEVLTPPDFYVPDFEKDLILGNVELHYTYNSGVTDKRIVDFSKFPKFGEEEKKGQEEKGQEKEGDIVMGAEDTSKMVVTIESPLSFVEELNIKYGKGTSYEVEQVETLNVPQFHYKNLDTIVKEIFPTLSKRQIYNALMLSVGMLDDKVYKEGYKELLRDVIQEYFRVKYNNLSIQRFAPPALSSKEPEELADPSESLGTDIDSETASQSQSQDMFSDLDQSQEQSPLDTRIPSTPTNKDRKDKNNIDTPHRMKNIKPYIQLGIALKMHLQVQKKGNIFDQLRGQQIIGQSKVDTAPTFVPRSLEITNEGGRRRRAFTRKKRKKV